MWSDLVQTVRGLLRAPGFSSVVILTLGFAFAAATAGASLFHAVLLRPLPVPGVDRLVVLANTFGEIAVNEVSYLDFLDWGRHATLFDGMALTLTWDSVNLNHREGTERTRVEYVSSAYFGLLGAEAALGRTFGVGEDSPEHDAMVVVLSHSLWRERFGADPSALGASVEIDRRPYTVVGVMPEGFAGLSGDARLWLPFRRVAAARGEVFLADRAMRVANVLARLQPGVEVGQARAQVDQLARRLAEEHPASNRGYGGNALSLFDFIYRHLLGYERIERAVGLLAAGAGLVLLLAWINVTHLFLLRGLNQRQPMAVRAALGGSRWRLLRLALLEGFCLAVPAAALGFWGARLGSSALVATGLVELAPAVEVVPGGGTLAVSLGAGLLAATTLGLLVGWQHFRGLPLAALQSGRGAGATGHRRAWVRPVLTFSQTAFATLLAIIAALLLHSLGELRGAGLGFAADDLLTFELDLSTAAYDERSARVGLVEAVREAAASLPGVRHAGIWGAALPGVGGGYIELAPLGEGAQRVSEVVRGINHHISPGALGALGIEIVAGRDLTVFDTQDTPVVALLSKTLAHRLFPGRDPLGRRFAAGPGGSGLDIEVVGVVDDVLHGSRLRPPEPLDFYLAYAQRPVRNVGFFLLTAVEPATVAAPMRRILRRLDPDLALYGFTAARQRLRTEEAPARLATLLVLSYAVLALLVAGIGVYSTLAYAVRRELPTLGVRMALGAGRREIRRHLLERVVTPAALGLLAGGVAALATSRLLAASLYGSGASLAPLLAAATTVALTVLAAAWLPTRRAMALDPATALHQP